MGTDLLDRGLELMLVGMGTVFLFLTLLVLATQAMSRVVAMLPAGAAPAAPRGARDAGSEDRTEELAAVVAAVELHRSRQQLPTTSSAAVFQGRRS